MDGCTVQRNNVKNYPRGWEAGGYTIAFTRGAVLENSRSIAPAETTGAADQAAAFVFQAGTAFRAPVWEKRRPVADGERDIGASTHLLA